jgi:hypothetical protein
MLIEYQQMNKVIEERYKCFPPFIPEFFAVKHKLKPLTAHIIPANVPQILEQISMLCSANGLHIGHSDFKLYFDHVEGEHKKLPLDSPEKGGDIFLFISYSKDLVREAVFDGVEFEAKARYYLGYPECCVKSYSEIGEDQNLRFMRPLRRTESPSFLLNNFLHWEGPYYLISHFPCSYSCEPSIQYASRLLRVIEKEDPKLGKSIRFLLTRPILYNGNKSHVRFNGGFRSPGRFEFDTVYGQRYPSVDQSFLTDQKTLLYHNNLIDELEDSDTIIFSDDSLTIMNKKGNRTEISKREDTVLIQWKK